jgi:anthranilate synthase/aminodeoxychorismate synthase-like glutamine amidotransferase
MLDNYDSFTWNLVNLLVLSGADVKVVRNDEWTLAEVIDYQADAIVISPGPGRPEDSGICPAVLAELAGKVPILGICLGHQLIARHFGGRIVTALAPMHGKVSKVHHNETGWFEGISKPMPCMRYHSLVVDSASLPPVLRATAWTDEGEIMALTHQEWPILGLQFHPESVLTPEGPALLKVWVEARGWLPVRAKS